MDNLKTKITNPKLPFISGKYEGKTFESVKKNKPSYIKWLEENGIIASETPKFKRYLKKGMKVSDIQKKIDKHNKTLLEHMKLDIKAQRVRYLLFLINKTIATLFEDVKDALPIAIGKQSFRNIFNDHIDIFDLSFRQNYSIITRSKIIDFCLKYTEDQKYEYLYNRYHRQRLQIIDRYEHMLNKTKQK